jgi:hypothetical protein
MATTISTPINSLIFGQSLPRTRRPPLWRECSTQRRYSKALRIVRQTEHQSLARNAAALLYDHTVFLVQSPHRLTDTYEQALIPMGGLFHFLAVTPHGLLTTIDCAHWDKLGT